MRTENVASSSCYVCSLLRRFPLANIPHSRAALHQKTERSKRVRCIWDGRSGFSSKRYQFGTPELVSRQIDFKNILKVCCDLFS